MMFDDELHELIRKKKGSRNGKLERNASQNESH